MSSLLTQLGQKTKVELDKKLALAGGTMTGALTLSGAPTANLHAATKQYVDGEISTVSSSVSTNTSNISTNTSNISGLQTELDATQAGAGLGTDGSYTANGSANYISSVATLQAADNALDAQIKTNADAIASNDSDISTLQSNVSSNDSDIATLQSNVSSNDSDISSLQSDVSTAQSDISTLQSNVSSNDSDISTLQSNVSSNDTDISALQTKAGSLASDGNSASFSGDISAANAVFSGNLTVQGTTTSVQTTNIDVSDSLMNLSKGAASGANASNDGGFIVERGSSESNVAFIWDEGDDKFKVLSTSATAASTDISGTDGSAAAAKFDADLYQNGVEVGSVAEFEAALTA